MDVGHAKGKTITPETALSGVGVPLHPGAEKYNLPPEKQLPLPLIPYFLLPTIHQNLDPVVAGKLLFQFHGFLP